MKLSFTIPGAPQPKQRTIPLIWKKCRKCGRNTCQRACRCGSEDLSVLHTSESTPTKTRDYEKSVGMWAHAAMQEAGLSLFSGPITLHAEFAFLIPESRACHKHKEGCKKLHEGDRHFQRPDLDNLLKSLKDGCNKIVWVDDCLIHQFGVVRKIWSSSPYIKVEVVCE